MSDSDTPAVDVTCFECGKPGKRIDHDRQGIHYQCECLAMWGLAGSGKVLPQVYYWHPSAEVRALIDVACSA